MKLQQILWEFIEKKIGAKRYIFCLISQQPIPPDTVYKFFGVNPDEADEVVQQ